MSNQLRAVDSKGFDLEIGDWARLTHHEYQSGQKFVAGQPVRVIDIIMDSRGVQVEVRIHQTKILVPPNRLLFHQRPGTCSVAATKASQPVCPVCKAELRYLHGADYCNSCRMPLWEIVQGFGKKFSSGG